MLTLNDILSSPDKLFSVKDVCKLVGVSDSAVWNWVRFNKINSTKVGNTWVFKGQDIIDYLNKQQRGGFKNIGQVLSNHKLPYERE